MPHGAITCRKVRLSHKVSAMRILIVGAGAIGSNLAEQLALEHHDVSIVDAKEEVIKRLGAKIDALVVHGNGASPQILEQAGIKDVELAISVTDSDELNMIVSLLARNYGVKTRIARIRNSEYSGKGAILSRQQLAIDRIINPEEIAVKHMEELIYIAGATEAADFAESRIRLMGFHVPEDAPITGRSLGEIREKNLDEFLIVAIHRGPDVIVPQGKDHIQAHDRIYVLMPAEFIDLFTAQLYKRVQKAAKVVIFGATRMGIGLARRLEKKLPDVTMIDPDHEACVKAAEILEKTTVLHGSALDPDLIHEVKMENTQVFCALSNDDASNVMAALLAKDHGVDRTIVNVGEPDFVPIVDRIGLDSAINPRLLAVDVILRFVRAGNILSVVHLAELKAEVVELVPSASSPLINRPLSELASEIPKGALIGAIIRNDQMVIPKGDSVIAPGERVIVFSTDEALPAIEKLIVRSR